MGRVWSAQGCFPAGPRMRISYICLGLCCYSLGIGPLEHRVSCLGRAHGGCWVSEHWSSTFGLCGSPALSHIVSLALSQGSASAESWRGFACGLLILCRPCRWGARAEAPPSSTCLCAGSIETWLILPVVICLSQRLSHACLSISFYTAKLRMAH